MVLQYRSLGPTVALILPATRMGCAGTSSLVGGEEGAQSCPCDKADESSTHIVVEGEVYKEERNVLRGEDEESRRMRLGEVWYI